MVLCVGHPWPLTLSLATHPLPELELKVAGALGCALSAVLVFWCRSPKGRDGEGLSWEYLAERAASTTGGLSKYIA